MAHKIIALVDGSIYSKSVCEHAAWIAGRTGASVELMHVLGRREAGSGGDLSGAIALGARTALLEDLTALDEQRAKLAAKRGRAILDDAHALFGETGIEVHDHLRHGDLIDAITEKETDTDLVLIGKRGEAADFAKAHLGSNLERVVRAATKPLLVASRAFRPVDKVLIAYDSSPSAMRAVNFVARSPLYRGLEITVVTVAPQNRDAEKALAGAQALLAADGLSVETTVRPGQPETAISTLIAEQGFDHLVMGASGHSRLRTLFVGSTSLEMIRTCKVPILLVR